MAGQHHTLVGIFPTFTKASKAVRSLEATGFDPADVELVGDDAGAAAEVAARSYGREGFFVGLAFGFVLTLAADVVGGLARYPVAAIIGAFFIVGGFGMVGIVLGRDVLRRAPDASRFATAVRKGGAVVAVDCKDRCATAERVLGDAGASDVRDEVMTG